MLVLDVVAGGRPVAFPRAAIPQPRTRNASVAFITRRNVNGRRLLPLVRPFAAFLFVFADLSPLSRSQAGPYQRPVVPESDTGCSGDRPGAPTCRPPLQEIP